MSRRATLSPGRAPVLTPAGRVLHVPAFPCPRVELGTDTDPEALRIGNRDVPRHDGESVRDAAVRALIAQAHDLRGPEGGLRAEVVTAGSEDVWEVVVTGDGDLIDATTTPAAPRRRTWVWVLAGAAAAVTVLAAATTVVLSTRAPAALVVAAAPPTGTPIPYPQLPPPGYSGLADWSAPILTSTTPVITADGTILTLTGNPGGPEIAALNPGTGVAVWSVSVPRDAAVGDGLHLSTIDGAPVVAVTTTSALLWWPLAPTPAGTRPQGRVTLPADAQVSWAGSTPLIVLAGQAAAVITAGTLSDRTIPAGATALGVVTDPGQATVVVAANNVGQLWRLGPHRRGTPLPAPTTLGAPTRSRGLAAVAAFTATLPSVPTDVVRGRLVLVWFTPDPATEEVSVVDDGGSLVTGPVTVAATQLSNARWVPSPGHTLGAFGPVMVDLGAPAVHRLPAGWDAQAVTDTTAVGTTATPEAVTQRVSVTAGGQLSPLGSGVAPVGFTGGRAVVVSTVAQDTTVYALPPTAGDPTPTPSVSAPAPAPLPSAAPVPPTAANPPPTPAAKTPPVPAATPPPAPPVKREPPPAAPGSTPAAGRTPR